jgi:hypothetical protein
MEIARRTMMVIDARRITANNAMRVLKLIAVRLGLKVIAVRLGPMVIAAPRTMANIARPVRKAITHTAALLITSIAARSRPVPPVRKVIARRTAATVPVQPRAAMAANPARSAASVPAVVMAGMAAAVIAARPAGLFKPA